MTSSPTRLTKGNLRLCERIKFGLRCLNERHKERRKRNWHCSLSWFLWFWFILWVWCWSNDGWQYRTECLTGIMSQCNSSTIYTSLLTHGCKSGRLCPLWRRTSQWLDMTGQKSAQCKWSCSVCYVCVKHCPWKVWWSLQRSRFLPQSVYSETCSNQSRRAGAAQNPQAGKRDHGLDSPRSKKGNKRINKTQRGKSAPSPTPVVPW